MKPFKHHNAGSVKEAVSLLQAYEGKAKINAGGTDLLGALRDKSIPEYPEAVINIKTIKGLDYIKQNKKGLQIGALTKLADVARSLEIKGGYPVLAEAAYAVGGPQLRNVATMGGNLAQDVRCWYYRYSRQIGGPIACLRKGNGPCLAVRGDNRYHAIMGGKKCFAVCPSDTAVALAALDAQVIVAGPEGQRRIAVADFYNPLGNALNTDDIILSVEVPKITGRPAQRFLKFTLRKPIDFAVVSTASIITVADGYCTNACIVLGAVAPGPYRARAAEAFLKGRTIDEKTAERAGELALQEAKPLSMNAYKIEIAKTLVKRALMEADR
jgi:xanthine dehydrogenase YagS FAD-binding subunit